MADFVLTDAVRTAVVASARSAASRRVPINACPYGAQADDRERALARIWVGAYLATRPPLLDQIDYTDQDQPATDDAQPVGRAASTADIPAGMDSAEADAHTVAAGLAVRADDTGRVLMLQRANVDDDPAAGTWEFPGGKLDPGEDPVVAAFREWSEETGLPVPDGQIIGEWTSSDGVYQGFVLAVPSEDTVPIFDGRDQVTNPDDPDGDQVEALAWWDVDHLAGNPAVRPELLADIDRVLAAVDVDPVADDDMDVQALSAALDQADAPSGSRSWDGDKHPRIPSGQPGGGRFLALVDQLTEKIKQHHAGGGEGHPFDGFSREQLRRVAKQRGIDLQRGESRDQIAAKLLHHLGGTGDSHAAPHQHHTRAHGVDLLQRFGDQHMVAQIRDGERHPSHLSADPGLLRIAEMQGFDGKPRVVSRAEMDRLIADEGHSEIFRGVIGAGTTSAADIHEQTRHGEAFFGTGYSGNGYYFAGNDVVAEVYSDETPGSILRAALAADAKVVGSSQVGTGSGSHPALQDAGRWAAARGYDAIRVDRGGGRNDYFVILNRTALSVEEA